MNALPRILLISDVSVELTSAGSTLLYRLLEEYPKDRLYVVQSKPILANRILEGVKYKQISRQSAFVKRLSNSRFYPVASFIEYLSAHRLHAEVESVVTEFKPDVIVSVTFRFAWINAWKIAQKYKLPLHLILHDDIITAEKHGDFLRDLIKKDFAKVYQFAASRFCISHSMEEMYKRKYGVGGNVIYPMLSNKDIELLSSAPVQKEKKSLHFCYAGSLYTPDFPKMLDQLAKILHAGGHHLTLFTEATKENLKEYVNLQSNSVSINGFVHPNVLRDFMKREVDVNIVLNSFEEEEAFKWNFSSKLVEYTVVGLPVLLWGPASSGAIRWALNDNYEGVVFDNSTEKLSLLVAKLADTVVRLSMANHLRQLGVDTFSFEKNYNVFIQNITRANSSQRVSA